MISTIGIVTRNRPSTLERGLESYIQNIKAHGRQVSFVIMDDSELEETRADYKRRLQALKARYGVAIFYAGIEEKKRFVELLAKESGIDPNTIAFALLDPEGCGHTTGANRNALTLHTAGDMLLSVDDDTLCRIAAPLDVKEGLQFVSNPRFSDMQAFASAQDAQNAVRFEEKDILAIQETFLGVDIDHCLDAYSESDIDIQGVSPWFAKRLLDPKGRIKMTWMGILGDSGLTNSNYALWLTGRARQEVLSSEPHYRAVCRSRQILRVGRKLSIGGDGGMFQSVAIGLDNRDLLPPFSPTYRVQDGIFGALFLTCLRDDFVAYPPWAVLHDPQPVRENKPEDVWQASAVVSFNMVLKKCIFGFEPLGTMSITERMQAMGQSLIERASGDPAAFEMFVRQEFLKANQETLEHLERLLQTHHGQPRYWAADLKAYMKNLRAAQETADYAIPEEARVGRSAQAAGVFLRRMVLRFGHLLTAWPRMVDAAKHLKSKNISLALPITF